MRQATRRSTIGGFMPDVALLRIYLNDHLAGSVGGLALARRCKSSNEGTPLAEFLDDLVSAIEVERDLVARLLTDIGGTPNLAKQGAVWALEKLGRLKFNGKLTTYSDLSRLVELETLTMAVTGKLSLWRSLQAIESEVPEFKERGFEQLIKRSEEAIETLKRFSKEAAERAFGGA